MSKYLSTINALPYEGRVRELIMAAPAQLLRKEVFYSSGFYYLRDLRTVPEGVWQKEYFYFGIKFFSRKSLTIKELSNHGLTRGDVSITFHPRTTDDFKTACLNCFFNSLKGIRVVFFQPEVLTYLTCTKFEAIIVFH